MTDATVAILGRRLAQAKGAYLFPHRHDPNRALGSVKKAHEKALNAAQITPPFRIYDLRNTFGSRSTMAGVDLATLKELMGHSHITITMRYVHPTAEHKREAIRKLQRFNAEQTSATRETFHRSPQKSPQ